MRARRRRWLVGVVTSNQQRRGIYPWRVVTIVDSEQEALQWCRSRNNFIAPIEPDQVLETEISSYRGHYFPVRCAV